MITIKGITKSFGSLQVLKGIDLHIDKGEVVSIVGPSGAGKTTLLQIIGTLDRPDSGTVQIDSVDVTSLSQKKLSDFRNRHIGFVFQFHQLLPDQPISLVNRIKKQGSVLQNYSTSWDSPIVPHISLTN